MSLSPITVVFLLMTGVPLAAIQIRRMIKGELSPFGLKGLSDARKISIDAFDKTLLVISGVSFIAFMVSLAISY